MNTTYKMMTDAELDEFRGFSLPQARDGFAVTTGRMTIDEALDVLHEYGENIGKVELQNGLKSGAYPFGVCIQGETSCRYRVSRRKLYEWLAEQLMWEEIPTWVE